MHMAQEATCFCTIWAFEDLGRVTSAKGTLQWRVKFRGLRAVMGCSLLQPSPHPSCLQVHPGISHHRNASRFSLTVAVTRPAPLSEIIHHGWKSPLYLRLKLPAPGRSASNSEWEQKGKRVCLAPFALLPQNLLFLFSL